MGQSALCSTGCNDCSDRHAARDTFDNKPEKPVEGKGDYGYAEEAVTPPAVCSASVPPVGSSARDVTTAKGIGDPNPLKDACGPRTAASNGSSENLTDMSEAGFSESAASSVPLPNVGAAQQVVKTFVRSIVRGLTLSVLNTAGGSADCVVALDRKLTTLSLQRAGKKDAKKRFVPIEEITEIIVGDDVRDEVDLAVDELCVTLLLGDEGQAIGFRFVDQEARDTFALCLSMFVDGRRNEVDAKRKKGR